MRLPLGIALLAGVIVASPKVTAQPDLTTGHWSIVEIGGKRPRSPPTINFTRFRWLGLNTSCGPLWGWYRRSGSKLRMHIPGEGRYQTGSGSPCQGVDYRLLLGRVRTFGLESDKLILLSENGRPIARLVAKQ